jgi:hypothetical protein
MEYSDRYRGADMAMQEALSLFATLIVETFHLSQPSATSGNATLAKGHHVRTRGIKLACPDMDCHLVDIGDMLRMEI